MTTIEPRSSMDPSTLRTKFLFSGLLLIQLFFLGAQNVVFFYLAGILVLGLIADQYLQYRAAPVAADRVSSIPPEENSIFQLLGNLMRTQELEMRLRRAEFLWNVTLLKHTHGLTRMVGRGSAPSISEAIMRAEGDFEKRHEPEPS